LRSFTIQWKDSSAPSTLALTFTDTWGQLLNRGLGRNFAPILQLASRPGLPDFSCHICTYFLKRVKLFQIDTKLPIGHKIYIPNGRNLSQMAIKIPTFSISRPSKIYPNWNCWSENIPSGHPALGTKTSFKTVLPVPKWNNKK
jgi:hypothetical protein